MADNRREVVTQEDMGRSPGYLVRRLHQLSTAVFLEETEGCDLTPIQFSALIVIAHNPDTDAARVSDVISFDRTTVGQVLGRLEDKGLIRRRAGLADRRRKILKITPQGMEILARASSSIPTVEDRIVGGLDEAERAMFIALLQKLVSPASLKDVIADAAE